MARARITIQPPSRHYPNNFNTYGGNIPTGVWYWTPGQLADYNGPGFVNRDLLAREYYQYLFDLKEKDYAGYVEAVFKGSNWSADFGVRYVQTREHVVTYTQVDASTPGAITDLRVWAVHRNSG